MTKNKQKFDNSNIYNNNMEMLTHAYPEIAQKVKDCAITDRYEVKGTGPNNLINVFCKERNMFLYDENNPLEGIDREFEALDLKNARIALFLGFGLGYQVDRYAQKYSEKSRTTRYIVIEKDVELFKLALHFFDYCPMFENSNIKLFVGIDDEKLFPAFSDVMIKVEYSAMAKAVKAVYSYNTFLLNKEYYMGAIKAFREATLFIINFYGNCPEDSLIGIENMLANLKEIVSNPGINALYDKFNGKPAVVVATGPSLNKNKDLLKGLEDKALIISVDASLGVLINMGVKPHLVTALERVPATVKLVEGFTKEEVTDVFYAACPVVPKEAYEGYPGPRMIVYRNFDHFRWLEVDKGILNIKHSSANMAFKIAEALGCNPIILIGQDLAYSREGSSHAQNTFYGEKQERYSETTSSNRLLVMGNDGELIETHEDWNVFRLAYEVDIASYKGTCINATEGGALIKGTQVMKFSEAIEKHIQVKIDPLKIIKESIETFTDENVHNDIQRIIRKIDKTVEDLSCIQKMCFESVSDIKENEDRLDEIYNFDGDDYGREDLEWIEEIANRIYVNRQAIFKVQPTMQMFMMHIIQSYYIKFEMEVNEIPGFDLKTPQMNVLIIKKYREFLAVLHDVINPCFRMLEKAEKELQTKLMS